MSNSKVKATEEPIALEEASLADLQAKIKELEAKLSAREQQVEDLKQKDEGWLVFTPNPMYDGVTAGILFTDGIAFVQKDRKFNILDGSAKMVIQYLENDFGYTAQYFTKEQADELKLKLSNRAKERAEVQAKMGDAKAQLEKILEAHHF